MNWQSYKCWENSQGHSMSVCWRGFLSITAIFQHISARKTCWPRNLEEWVCCKFVGDCALFVLQVFQINFGMSGKSQVSWRGIGISAKPLQSFKVAIPEPTTKTATWKTWQSQGHNLLRKYVPQSRNACSHGPSPECRSKHRRTCLGNPSTVIFSEVMPWWARQQTCNNTQKRWYW